MEPSSIKKESLIHDYIAGALGGVCGLIVGHPFDTTKVQLQTSNKNNGYKSTTHALKHIHSNYGWSKGFLRGLSWPVISYGAVNSIFFGVYGSSLKYIRWLRDEGDRKSYLNIYIAGCVGGIAQLVIACPVDLIKVILQSQIQPNTATTTKQYFTSPLQCAQTIISSNGVLGLFKGLSTMFYRDVPSFGLYCASYEYLTDLMHKHKVTDTRGIISSLVAGGSAGTIAWLAVMPFDVIKSRWQADMTGCYSNWLDCCKKTVTEEGVLALYKGTLITCLRAFPVNAATFLVYSQSLNYFQS